MGVLTAAPKAIKRPAVWPRAAVASTAVLYVALVAATALRHEPWADEAQSWLLARDASLFGLWTRFMHYEGTPGLWQTLLHMLIGMGLPYGGLSLFSTLLGAGAAGLLLRYSPFPLVIRCFLPFTYYLAYQYAVIARSYDLIPLLLFGCAIFYRTAVRRIWLLTGLLLLLAAVSIHGFILAVAIWLACQADFVLQWRRGARIARPELLAAAGVFVCVSALIAVSAWPPPDGAFIKHFDVSARHLLEITAAAVRQAFTGEEITSLAAIAATLPFLYRGRALALFCAMTLLLCAAGSVIYTHVWHFGILFLAWIFCMWIAAERTVITWTAIAALVIVSAVQCYWTARSVAYDWTQPYSGSRAAAEYLRASRISRDGLYGIGYSAVAIQPYFRHNRYANFGGASAPAFWDWSSRNRSDDPSALFSSSRPEYVMAGYKSAAEHSRWARLTSMAGYEPLRHFDGNLYWRTGVLEPESFDLYRRGAAHGGVRLSSIVRMADPSQAGQLLTGFYGVESNAWRWTARTFSVALARPDGADETGAKLALHFFMTDAQSHELGPMTLTADLDGYPLPARTFSEPGEHAYSQDVPAAALRPGVVAVNFRFDKAAQPSGAEQRELGVIVTSLELARK